MQTGIREWIGQFNSHFQAARMSRIFQPKVSINLEKSGYRVKTAETGAELNEVMKLRFQVFHKEYRKTQIPFGVDVEPFDLIADHLIIQDLKTGRIVGTYRLISSLWNHQFYSQSEFEIKEFLNLPGSKLELSRACVHAEYRKGFVMHLLWRGLIEYIVKTDSKYLFGCSSVKTLNPFIVDRLADYFKENKSILEDIKVAPRANYRNTDILYSHHTTERVEDLVPPLLSAYLKAGAKLSETPAYDFDFQCVDFFTVLDLKSLTAQYERRYARC